MKDFLKFSPLEQIYNRFDFPIRLLYTQVPVLREFLHYVAGKSFSLYQSDFRRLDKQYRKIKKRLPHEISGKTVVELGPGSSLSIAVNCLLDGAEKVLMVDKYPRFSRENLHNQIEYFRGKKGSEKVVGEISNLDSGRFRLVRNGVENMEKLSSEKADIIMSNSVLEHVRNVKSAFEEMYRILGKGGVMYHKVDLRDHYNFERPLAFLKYSEKTWKNFLTKEGYSYTNRLRKDDYAKLLRKCGFGFKIIDQEMLPKNRINKSKMWKKFGKKETEDLRVLSCTIIARK